MSKLIRYGRYLLLGLLLCVGGCGIGSKLDDPLRIRYRQTVTFEGPQGQVQVSGVFEEVIRYSGPVPGYGPNIQSYRLGEALGAEVPGVGYVVQTMRYRTGTAGPVRTVVSAACGIPDWRENPEESPYVWMDRLDKSFVSRCELSVSRSSLVLIYNGGMTPYNATLYFPDSLPDELTIAAVSIERTTDPINYGRIPNTLWEHPKGQNVVSLHPMPQTKPSIEINRSMFIDESSK